MSWISKVSGWLFSSNSDFSNPAENKKLKDKSRKSSTKLKLEKRQRELATEIEKTFTAYEEKLYDLANTLNSLEDEARAEDTLSVEQSQDELRRINKRLEVASKSTHDLEQELAEWENRQFEDSSNNKYTEVIKEIIGSELAIRGVKIKVEKLEKSEFFQMPETNFNLSLTGSEPFIPEFEQDPVDISKETDSSLPELDPEYLLQAIKEATREAERWHVEPCGESDPEAALQVRHVKDLHAALRELDKKNGVSRDRLALAVRLKV